MRMSKLFIIQTCLFILSIGIINIDEILAQPGHAINIPLSGTVTGSATKYTVRTELSDKILRITNPVCSACYCNFEGVGTNVLILNWHPCGVVGSVFTGNAGCVVIYAPPEASIISGVWARDDDPGAIITILKNGNRITGTHNNASYLHSIEGDYDESENRYLVTVTRTNRSTNCTTVMKGEFKLINSRTVKTKSFGTDGKCDLPSNFAEEVILKKR